MPLAELGIQLGSGNDNKNQHFLRISYEPGGGQGAGGVLPGSARLILLTILWVEYAPILQMKKQLNYNANSDSLDARV